MESILTSVKKMLGITEEYEHFDQDLVMHINSIFSVLNQLGVGPKDGYAITGAEEVWSSFLPEGKKLEMAKSFMYLRVRLLFDPPTVSSVMEAMNRQASELEWRLNVAVDPPKEEKQYEG